MMNSSTEQRFSPGAANGLSSTANPDERVVPSNAFDLLLTSAALLFVHGQTTEKMIEAVTRMAKVVGFRAIVFPRWGDLTIRIEGPGGSLQEIIIAGPTGVDMGQVAAAMNVIDDICNGRTDVAGGRSALDAVTHLPSVSVARFALLAAAGAAALGVIFGEVHLVSLILIGFSAGAGACLRRWLAKTSRNLFVQPFCAALLAGIVGAIAVRFHIDSGLRLVAVCPCMVLVPGPHLLNGALDLARGRLPLGVWRFTYASLIIVMICTGLLVGLALGGAALPVSGPSYSVPLAYDAIAAGVAVAAYGTFFSMPWRTLPIPILIGMLAHACRWLMISIGGVSVEAGALVACLIVGIIITPIADRLRMPFAAFAFASVVSLIPGVFLFRMAGGLVLLVALGQKASPDLLLSTVVDGATAGLIILAMTFGLILPKMCIEHFWPSSQHVNREG
jgi:uncharacterized membrane protein YjjP (DUF1212 family)